MRPAAEVVVSRIRAGITPTVLEYGALLRESGCDQAEARRLVAQYQADIAERPNAENALMEQLRAFSLPRQ